MAKDRATGRQGPAKRQPPARPAHEKVVKLSIRMAESLRWRIRAYAAAHRVDIDDLIIRVIDQEMSGWYHARRGEAPGAERPDGPGEPAADAPRIAVDPGDQAA